MKDKFEMLNSPNIKKVSEPMDPTMTYFIDFAYTPSIKKK